MKITEPENKETREGRHWTMDYLTFNQTLATYPERFTYLIKSSMVPSH